MATIVSSSHALSLADPSLPPLTLQLTQLRDSLLLFVGTVPGPYAIGHDFACGMTRNGRATSTPISASATYSLSLAAKLSKRYGQQIFLSLDVGALAPGGASIEFALLLMEKSLVVKLDSLLRK